MRKNRIAGAQQQKVQQQKDRKNMTMPKQIIQKSSQSQTYKFFLGGGNNAHLVRRVLSTRKNWQQVDDSKYLFLNMRWQQTSRGFKYDNCVDNRILRQSFNHFEFHHEISNKENLLRNMTEYCQHNKLNVFDYLPVTYILCLNDPSFDHSLHAFLKFFQHNLPQNMRKKSRKHWMSFKRRSSHVQSSSVQRKVNYFYCKPELKQVYRSDDSQFLWILKPTSFNRGFGIHLFNQIEKLEEWMNKYIHGYDPKALSQKPQKSLNLDKSVSQNNVTSLNKEQNREENDQKEQQDEQQKPKAVSSPQIKKKDFRIREPINASSFMLKTNSFVVQKYLEKPLLISGRKFDIRIWVLVTHELKAYWFPQGYLRTSSYMYQDSQKSIDNVHIHLTNNAVQKHNKDYGKYQDGNQLSFRHLQNAVNQAGGNYDKIISKIKNVIKLTLLSVRKKLNKRERQFCFEIFGYDFMVDSKCKPWLIQVNTNPCIQQSSRLLQELIPRMLDDAFALTIDKMFPPSKNQYLYPVKNEKNDDNLWQLIVDLKK